MVEFEKSTRKVLYEVTEPKTLFEMTWLEVVDLLKETDIAFVIVGATEQHGPHNPNSLDTMLPLEYAKRAALKLEKEGIKLLICNPIPFGCSQQHMYMPGSISISPPVLEEFTFEVCRSLYDQGFNKFLLFVGHGGHEQEAVCSHVAFRIQQEFGVTAGIFNWMDHFTPENIAMLKSEKKDLGGEAHGGEIETAMALAVCPDLVLMDKAKKAFSDKAQMIYHEGLLKGRLARHGGVQRRSGLYVPTPGPRDYTVDSLGFIGDATVSTKEVGEELLDMLSNQVVKSVKFMLDIASEKYDRKDTKEWGAVSKI
jgi:creatinine amidohydrolase/Fe(II)-dependent formamide hydrolase-like protein